MKNTNKKQAAETKNEMNSVKSIFCFRLSYKKSAAKVEKDSTKAITV